MIKFNKYDFYTHTIMRCSPGMSVKDITEWTGISRATIYRRLALIKAAKEKRRDEERQEAVNANLRLIEVLEHLHSQKRK